MTKNEQQFLDAATKGNLKKVEALLKAGIDVDARDSRGCPTKRTALMHAADNGHLEIVDILLKSGARINSVDKGHPIHCPGGNTALILALQKGYLKIAHCLLDAGASPKTKGGGTSVINVAACLGNEALIKRLIKLGADIRQIDGSGCCPVSSALISRKSKVVRMFLDLGVDPNSRGPAEVPILSDAISNGDEKLCRELIDRGANPELKDRDGFTPLIRACTPIKRGAIKFLLSLEVDVNNQDNQGRTALDIVRNQINGFSPEVRHRLIDFGLNRLTPVKELKAIEEILIKAGGKTGREDEAN